MSAPIKALIADDEPLARSGIREFLANAPEVEIVGEAGDGLAAVSQILALRPDLVFLDVQMPELDGFEVLEALPSDVAPAVVFVTAHEAYALRAFDAHAVDYLLKPFDRARFLHSLAKAETWLGRRGEAPREALLATVRASRGRERFCVKHAGGLRVVPASAVLWIEARGNYVHLHTDDGEHLLRATLGELERQLDGGDFLRVHRSAIVRVSAIRHLERRPGGDYDLRLVDGRALIASRTQWPALAKRLGRIV